MHKHKLLCFAADMEMLPPLTAVSIQHLWGEQRIIKPFRTLLTSSLQTKAKPKPIKLWHVRVGAHCENKY